MDTFEFKVASRWLWLDVRYALIPAPGWQLLFRLAHFCWLTVYRFPFHAVCGFHYASKKVCIRLCFSDIWSNSK